MAVHSFSTREELHSFWRQGRGYLLNNFKNCLHETTCKTYQYNPPGVNYTRQGFDTAADVIATFGPGSRVWQSCPTCKPHLSLGVRPAHTAPGVSSDKKNGMDAERESRQRQSGPAALDALSDANRAKAVIAYDAVFGEMDRALWCLSQHCRAALLEGQSTPVVEALVWTVKSWWGVQGVRTESKPLIARALASLKWSRHAFAEVSPTAQEGVRFAVDRVSEVVRQSMSLGVTRREFSLASKVLHWLLPWRIPVYDSFVRERLGVPGGWDHPEAYRAIAERLLEVSQNLAGRDVAWIGTVEPKSILRGLDKCLWWLGGGNAGNAVVVRDPWRVVRQLGLRAS